MLRLVLTQVACLVRCRVRCRYTNARSADSPAAARRTYARILLGVPAKSPESHGAKKIIARACFDGSVRRNVFSQDVFRTGNTSMTEELLA
jgi:hypothetical protein